jgi:hypothetical protein
MVFRTTLVMPLVLACAALAQKYSGPRPPKPDVPYLVHADNLVETEIGEAKEQKGKKEEITYVIAGANSPAKTPLASPIFLIEAQNIAADHLQLYRLESKNGQREILFSRKKKQTAQPIRTTATPLGTDNLYRIEVDQTLQPGEYSLTPEGSNQVFCFAVF